MAEVGHRDVALDPARRVVFKTVDMPWEDLAVAGLSPGKGMYVCGHRQLQLQS